VRRQPNARRAPVRALCLAAIVLVALVIAGCGGDDNGGSSGGTSGAGQSLNLQTDGQITAGAEFPVKGFVELPIDHPKGFEVDLADAIARQVGVPTVKWTNVPFSGLFSPAPKNFDFAINEITITPQRARVVDFSVPYFNANQGFLINKGGPAEGVKSIADMKDLQFGFQATTTGGDYIMNTIKPGKQPREYSTLGAASKALANGQIDAFVMDVAIGAQVVKQFPQDIALTGQFQTGEKYGLLFQKGNPLRRQVDQAIRKLQADGTIKRLQGKWFPGTQELPTFR
jgi:polar amino acid transport system substrate-binding protein